MKMIDFVFVANKGIKLMMVIVALATFTFLATFTVTILLMDVPFKVASADLIRGIVGGIVLLILVAIREYLEKKEIDLDDPHHFKRNRYGLGRRESR